MLQISRLVAVVLCSVTVATTGACQSQTDVELLESTWRLVADRHYDTELHGLDWPGIGEKYRVLIEASGSRAESLEIIDRMLQELGDSHCIVGELKDAASVSSPYIFGAADPGIDLRLVAGEALVTRVKPGSSAARAGIQTGFVITAIDGAPVGEMADSVSQRPPFTPSNELFFRVQALLWALYGDPGTLVSVRYIDGQGLEGEATLERADRGNGQELFPGFPPVFLEYSNRALPGGVQYLSFNAFQPDTPQTLIDMIESSDRNAPMILDLRGNNGGSATATLELLARFSPRRQLVYHRQSREQSEAVYVEPADYIHQGAVVILVDELSVSAAENFAGIMQKSGLATVIGQRTPGQLLWGEGFPLGDDVMALIPVAEIIYPDGTSLEGVGVTPNREIELNRDSLLNGVDTQLQAAVELLTNSF